MDDARKLLRECRDYVLQYKLDNPKHFYKGIEQDPMGAHALLDRIDAFLAQPAASAEDVRIPTSMEEARLMHLLATQYLSAAPQEQNVAPSGRKP